MPNVSRTDLGQRPLLTAVVGLGLVMSSTLASAAGVSWSKDISGTPDSGTGTSFGVSQIGLAMPLQSNQGRDEGLSIDAGVQISSFDWAGADAAASDYYWLSLPMKYWQRRDNGGEIHAQFEPGLMTDLDGLSTDSLMANVRFYWRQPISQTLFWQAGVVVDRRFGDLLPRPLAGIAWKALSKTEVLLGFPETRVQTGWNKQFSTYLHVRPDGGVWREQLKGLNGTYDVRYRDWKMGVGTEFWLRGNAWLMAEVGQQRLRKITAYDSTGARVEAEPADSNYWQVGLKLRF
ncbi:DUF6268 family outer membrane beta-barrel protein [Oceanobacter mangrovi]|uniref:DUF6268 family outer membrane beta-barrel protein n=1 Tax=Oceanobacter mangrovi TaxID=2862510 RepID=UPI001C8E276E|nr:DUF6268 family outer membrane beta-barrel protein [Oceanobacter mangrovi]